ncbi:MAG: hypothetical protein AB7T49_12475 [Oligoflexales bacterium]
MRLWQKIGTIFPALLLVGLARPLFAQILPPGSPATNLPPQESEEDLHQRIQVRKTNREQEQILENPQSESQPTSSKQQKRPVTPGPGRHHAYAQLAFPFIKTSSEDYEDFVLDPSMFVHYRYLLNPNPAGNWAFWAGFSVLPISGTGTYKSTPASFGFLYFGPMVSVGKFFLERSADEDAPGKASAGFTFSLGLTAQSRFVQTERGQKPSGTEFEEKGAGYDPPGVWNELNYFWKLRDNFSFDASLGGGLGKNKAFYYAAFGLGFWY